jgi:MFS superfamily sulfate permease-like transporter
MAIFLLSIRGIAFVEGRIVEALLGVRMPRKARVSESKGGIWEKVKKLFSEKHTWASLAYSILHLPLGIIYFTVFITLIAISLAAIAAPLLELIFDYSSLQVDRTINGTEYHIAHWSLPFLFLAGIFLMTTTMHLAKWVGRGHGAIAKAILVD